MNLQTRSLFSVEPETTEEACSSLEEGFETSSLSWAIGTVTTFSVTERAAGDNHWYVSNVVKPQQSNTMRATRIITTFAPNLSVFIISPPSEISKNFFDWNIPIQQFKNQ
jgi:hypothetical protein